ncbi:MULTISPECIES: hypothetical protein [unclassified Moorena]|uniref:hypothetical protein n=1 Tax=unclassified Moorena TaxID=2683338 RepID=UPI0013C55F60|nr:MULTISPECIES: hypothetical protein [unclassified Moorena]NEO23606.1 hypothetical protein [Moorena sp. SIO4A5]NEQ57736.1 hypothetical protein [Moorena sp. SIO4A1]
MLCALRRVLKEAVRLDLIDLIDYSKAVDLVTIANHRQLRGRTLSKDEIIDTPRPLMDGDSCFYEVTCLTRPEPEKIEVSSPQAYLVYDPGFGVPHRT